jgi:hypothetical protein
MSDITMCKGTNCPLKEKCFRFTAKADEYQSYFNESPLKDDKCDMYWGEKSEKIHAVKHTAVEWLQVQIDNKDMGEIPMWIYDFIQEAKLMEKEQIVKAFQVGYSQNYEQQYDTIEQFYNETYKGGNNE